MSRNVLALDSFIDWVATQPRWRVYLGGDPSNCALTRYARSLGWRGSDGQFRLVDAEGKPHDLRDVSLTYLIGVVMPRGFMGGMTTYGGLHRRLLAARGAIVSAPSDYC